MKPGDSPELAALRKIEAHARDIRRGVGCLVWIAVLAILASIIGALLGMPERVRPRTPPPASSP